MRNPFQASSEKLPPSDPHDELEEAHRRRLIVRPDAFGRTDDEIVRTFTRETLYGEQQTARYRGTGFYAGRSA